MISNSFSYKLITWVSRLPMTFLQSMAKTIAYIENTFHFSKTAKYVHLNLQIALPELSTQQQKQIIQQAISNEIQSYFEFFHIWGANNQDNISRIHQVHGADYFHQALAEQKGVVLIVPHFGTWEIMNAWCAQFTKMTILYKPVKNKVADEFVRQARSREQANLVPTNESGVREILKALKKGGTTVILPDHSPNIESEMVDYFAIPLYSSNLTAKLVQKTKAKALFLYAMRNEQGGFEMFIEPMPDEIYQGTANDGTLLIHHKIEQLIRAYPQHYHWSYKRFKANPVLDGVYHESIEQALKLVEQVRKS
ncbi:lysophospholipid acyltransferase family protein [Moraxella sp. ZY210820]|uniref:lysophospholipid acyltransferase family protein n=2 Tax=unclassified Moraxella TaxID=2685852 RepID=UPI00351DF2EC